MRILALDFGDKRIGVAVSDPLGLTAQGLESVLKTKDGKDLEQLRAICVEKKVERCVVGLPLSLSGEMGPRAKHTLEWIETLKQALPCPVETWDERLTSKQATRLMVAQGLSRRKQKENSDRLAATLILQSYLETRRPPSLED